MPTPNLDPTPPSAHPAVAAWLACDSAPSNLAEEVRRYDEMAGVSVWPGPRYRMTYRVLGSGPPLLWVPGIASTHRVYAILLNQLSRRFRTIQYTYPGDDPDDRANLDRIGHKDLVDDLFGLLDHLKIDRAFLAGISFGSTVTLAALARDSRRFPGAVLQGGFAHRRLNLLDRIALQAGKRITGTASQLPFRRTVLRWKSRRDFPQPIADRWPSYVDENGLTPIRGLAHRSALLARIDLRPSLKRIASNLLLVQGQADRIVPHSAFEELRSTLPRAEAVLLPDVGHIPHLSHPEQFADLIEHWLLQNGDAPTH